jgi:DNA phosphorothioation-dependent restriction protein DptH
MAGNESPLGSAIGRFFSNSHGLKSVLLPEGLGSEVANSVVVSINRLSKSEDGSDRSIRLMRMDVLDPEANYPESVKQLGLDQVMENRYDNRVVVSDSSSALVIETLTTAFAPVLRLDFPSGIQKESNVDSGITLGGLADAVVRDLREGVLANADISDDIYLNVASSLTECFWFLRTVYETSGEFGVWNVSWFSHVDSGLQILSNAIAGGTSVDFAGASNPVFAAFGLPQPKKLLNYAKQNSAARFVEIVADRWTSTDEISAEIHRMNLAGPPVQLGRMDWSGISGFVLGAQQNPVFRLAFQDRKNAEYLGAWGSVQEDHFFGTGSSDISKIEIFTNSLDGGFSSIAGDLLASDVGVVSVGGSQSAGLSSTELCVVLPVERNGVPVEEMNDLLRSSDVGIRLAGKSGFEFVDSEKVVTDRGIEIRGQISHPATFGKVRFPSKCIKIGVEISPVDSLRSFVDRNAAARVLLVPSNIGNPIFESFKGQKSKAPELLPPLMFEILGDCSISPIEGGDDTAIAISVELGQQARLFSLDCTILGVGANVSGLERGSAKTVDSASDGGEISSGISHYTVDWEVAGADSTLSPLIAALLGTQPSLKPLPPVAAKSLRGVIEEEYRTRIAGNDESRAELVESLGHVILPSDSQVPVSGLIPSPTGHYLVPQKLGFTWAGPGAPTVPSDLLGSAELEQFRTAIRDLGLEQILTFEIGRETEDSVVYPSQARLTGRSFDPDLKERIEGYLLSYSHLIQYAKSIATSDPFGQVGVFWASYPFSVSIWSKSPLPKCNVVMLSPLHPLRISWLMGVEQAFRDSTEDLRRALAGVVEGWNLPLLGPANDLGRMMAQPADNGPDQIFLGWNLMTRVPVGGPDASLNLEFAGNLRIPGSSSSGISRRGVTRAIKDYRSVYPHISTLTIDLASSQASPRMPELDAAVIAEASGLRDSRSSSSLRGGIRVLDSLNRTGPIPDVSALQNVDGDGNLRPLVWRRYAPGSTSDLSSEVDLRILQDPGAVTWVVGVNDEATNIPAGVLGPIPFRRLAVHGQDTDEQANSSIIPSIGSESCSVFSEALSILETSIDGDNYRVSSWISPDYFGDSAPNWTVSGETAIRPGAMPDLLPDDTDSRVLWEWSPSFLEQSSSDVPELDSRPYISITRVSAALRDQLKARLGQIQDFPHDDPARAVHQVLRTLGIRGVGLSRLAAGKDERTVGAIGFALSLELAGRNASGISGEREVVDHWDFVFPIDVCIQYLRGMGGKDLEEISRRADLLIFRVHRDGTVRISPIEIKVRKLSTVVASFPSEVDGDLMDAREQLVQTMRLLDSIRERFDKLDVSSSQGLADRYLMSTALAALIDAAIGLSVDPIQDRGGLRTALNQVASGDGGLELARPIVIFLGNGNMNGLSPFLERRGLEFEWHASTSTTDRYAQFLINAGRLGGELWGGSGQPAEIQTAWSELVEWCFDREISGEKFGNPETSNEVQEVHPSPQSLGDRNQKSNGGDTDPLISTKAGGDGDAGLVWPSAGTRGDPEAGSGNSPSEGKAVIDGDGIRFEVGTLSGVSGEKWVDFWPSNTALSQMNIGVVGTLGTGKTELVKSLVYQIRTQSRQQGQPVSFLVLDYKGDYKGEDFLASVGGSSVGHEPIPLNLFELAGEYSPRAAWRKARQFVDVIKRIYRGVGAVQSERLEKSITDLFEEAAGVEPTIDEVADRYRTETGKADAVTGILSVFTRGGWFSSDRSKMKKFSEMLGDEVLVVSLDDPEMDDSSKTAVAALFLNLYRQHMLDQTKWPFQGEDPQLRRLNSFVLIDEAHNVMNLNLAALREILLQGRQFGVGAILSSQFLSHFKNSDDDFRQPLLTWFIHKVPSLRQQELRDLGMANATEGLVSEVLDLPVSSSLYKSFGVDGRIIREIPYWRLIEIANEGGNSPS